MESLEIESRATAARRKVKLDWYENEAMKALNSVASIFRQLRDDPIKPYLATHLSFEEYCLDRWKMTARRTRQIIAADDVRLLLLDSAPEMKHEINDLHESQLRELVTTPPAQRVEVLRHAVTTPGRMTALKIKQAKARTIDAEAICAALDTPDAAPPTLCPHCGRPM